MKHITESKPVVFACAGCSYAGQIAYRLALELDRRGIAEMSCLAGLGAEKPHFMKLAARRPVWIIDGCPIECSAGITAKVNRREEIHIRLHEYGIKKKQTLPDSVDYDALVAWVIELSERHKLISPPAMIHCDLGVGVALQEHMSAEMVEADSLAVS